ncbi:MAG: ribosome maturation factor RimP [bacterium]
MDRNNVVGRVREMAAPLARAEGVELLDVTFIDEGHGRVLRLTIERPGGATAVADCQAVSRAVERMLDAGDDVPAPYTLEVSSAGLTRPLRTLEDFRRAVGGLVRVSVRDDRAGGPVTATLLAVDDAGLTLELDGGARRVVPLAEIRAANREIRFPAGRRRP